jgi:hypothetical protein
VAVGDQILGYLHRGRPVIDVTVGMCDLLQDLDLKKADLVQPVKCRALIDTSRRVTSVSAKVLKGIGLLANAGRKKQDAGGYCISLGLISIADGVMTIPCLHATEHEDEEFAVMIGADLIRTLHITIDGPQKRVTITRCK